MKELEEYCSEYSEGVYKMFRVFTVASIIIAILVFLFYRNSNPTDMFFVMIFPVIIFIIGLSVMLGSPYEVFKRKMKKFSRKGLEQEVVEDFKKSESQYRDLMRMGEKYIFAAKTGNIVPYSSIKKIYRKLDLYMNGNTVDRSEFYIVYETIVSPNKLCNLDDRIDIDDEQWKIFTENMRWRSPKTNVVPKTKIKYIYPDSGD